MKETNMNKMALQRQVNWRIKLIKHALEETQNVARTCRHFGLSRQTFYKWVRRYKVHGEAGLCDHPKVPHKSPRTTPSEIVSKILYLRQNYHFGPGRISHYLQRYHQICVATSTVHRILQRHNLNRLPSNLKNYRRQNHQWKRYEKQQPGHRLQVDVKFIERIPGSQKRLYQFTAIDDCTRMRVLKIYDRCNQKTATAFMEEVLKRLPFRILVVQTDNGSEFQSLFHWYLRDRDIQHVYIKPRTPRLNGKVERSHRIDNQEFYQLLDKDGISDNVVLFNTKLREWEDYYNLHRPHGALDGQTPYERLKQKTSLAL
jgi:transposase InsO family protein